VRAAGYRVSHLTKVRAAVRALIEAQHVFLPHHRPPAPTGSQIKGTAAVQNRARHWAGNKAQCATVLG